MKADWLNLGAARILSLTSDPQGEPPRGGKGSSFGDTNQERRQSQQNQAKSEGQGQPQGQPEHYDTSDTEYGGGSADDDTSAGYGLGGSTGNSSDPRTGLSPIDND